MLGRIVLWTIRILVLGYLFALAVAPTALAYDLLGWRWAALAALATVGVVWFAVRFGPWLIGRALGQAVRGEIDQALADLDGETPQIDAWENHATIEGAEWWLFDY